MVKYVIEPFIGRLPQYGKMERFGEEFFRVVERAMKFTRFGWEEEKAWEMAFRAGLEVSDPLVADSRLVCGIALALLDAGLISSGTLRAIMHEHPAVSEAYFRRWVKVHISSCVAARIKRAKTAKGQDGNGGEDGEDRRGSRNGLTRLLSV